MTSSHSAGALPFPDSFDGALKAIEASFERQWTDGLPLVPATEGSVAAMMSTVDRPPSEVLGPVPPRGGVATIESVAINAVMAGCRPEYFPVVAAAVEALLDESFNLNGVQATTHSATPIVMVSGPVVRELAINHGTNLFGHGFRANATIGRAVRLVLVNLGGGHPETGDKSVLGNPAKYSFCIAEMPDPGPWGPMHAEFGLDPDDSAVVVFACEPPRGVPGKNAGTLIALADALSTVAINNAFWGGQACAIMGPKLVETLAADGWTKTDVRYYVYENARVNLDKLLAARDDPDLLRSNGAGLRWSPWFDMPVGGVKDRGLPVMRRVEDLLIVVAGAGGCALLPGWGYMGGQAVARAVRPGSGYRALLAGRRA